VWAEAVHRNPYLQAVALDHPVDAGAGKVDFSVMTLCLVPETQH
jgi:hypothetical protein